MQVQWVTVSLLYYTFSFPARAGKKIASSLKNGPKLFKSVPTTVTMWARARLRRQGRSAPRSSSGRFSKTRTKTRTSRCGAAPCTRVSAMTESLRMNGCSALSSRGRCQWPRRSKQPNHRARGASPGVCMRVRCFRRCFAAAGRPRRRDRQSVGCSTSAYSSRRPHSDST